MCALWVILHPSHGGVNPELLCSGGGVGGMECIQRQSNHLNPHHDILAQICLIEPNLEMLATMVELVV
jgi:hypothetical protein